MNDHRAEIVGICKASPSFQTFPIIYTRYSLALNYAPQERRVLSFVLAKAEPGVAPADVCVRIKEQTGLQALSNDGFAWLTITYYMRRTGIPINFGTTVLLGFIIGASIAGQTFYLFTIGNLKQFGTLKAMGANNRRIVGMVLAQGAVRGRDRLRSGHGGGVDRRGDSQSAHEGHSARVLHDLADSRGHRRRRELDHAVHNAVQPAARARAGTGVGVSLTDSD